MRYPPDSLLGSGASASVNSTKSGNVISVPQYFTYRLSLAKDVALRRKRKLDKFFANEGYLCQS